MTDKQRWDLSDKVLFDYKLRQIQPVRSKMAGNSLWISQNWGKIQPVWSKITGNSLWISQNSGKIQPGLKLNTVHVFAFPGNIVQQLCGCYCLQKLHILNIVATCHFENNFFPLHLLFGNIYLWIYYAIDINWNYILCYVVDIYMYELNFSIIQFTILTALTKSDWGC